MRPSQSLIPLLITFWLALSAALPPNRWIAAASHTHSQPTVDASCQAYDILHDFIQENRISKNDFKVQGWRWHTLSLIREARRLAKAATNTSLDLTQAIEYVVGFNMQGLHKIQDELFFPWVRQQIQQCAAPHIAQAFATVMDELEAQEQECRRLGKLLLRNGGSVPDLADQLASQATDMLHTENTLLVPLVAHFIPIADQKAFNNKVIRHLGIWDSRLHLVGMHEAVMEQPEEIPVFQQTIPYLPRSMIPRWKRNLYDPKVVALDGVA